MAEDPVYRETCRNSQKQWREENPDYMKRYLAKRRVRDRSDAQSSLVSELHRLLDLVKNNVAFDLRSSDASIWLVCPEGSVSEKNTFAHAKVVVLQGVLHAVVSDEA